MGSMNEHYAAVLTDLRTRRKRLETELAELEAGIQSIMRIVGRSGESLGETSNSGRIAEAITVQDKPSPGRFAHISVRWGVLWHLAEEATGGEKTGEIADAVRAGGYQSNAASFSNMVSGVLSLMKQKGEVVASDDGNYLITDVGRRTWQLIRQSAKFRDAIHPTGPSLLSVQ